MFFKKKTIKEQVSNEIVRQLVSEALTKEQELIAQKEELLKKKAFDMNQERLRLEKIKSFGTISSVQLHEEIQKMGKEYHNHTRLSSSEFDDDGIKATSLLHTINFLKKCVE